MSTPVYVLHLAWRYLRALWLTYLAVGMVFAGVAAMVVVLSVMWGLEEFTRTRLRGTISDVEILRPGGAAVEDCDAVCARVRAVPGVAAVWPVVEGAAVLRCGAFSRGVRVVGLDYADPEASRDLVRFIEAERRQDPSAPAFDPVAKTSAWLGHYVDAASAGDAVSFLAAVSSHASDPGPSRPSAQVLEAGVAGRFLSRSYFDDEWGVILPLAAARRLFRLNHPPAANRVRVRLADGVDDVAAARGISAALGPGYAARPWTMVAEREVEMLRVENRIIAVIMAAMLALAGFGILAILNMQVTHKVAEIGILKALGGTRGGIAGIFLLSGTAIGTAGAGLALAASLPFLRHINGVHAWLCRVTGWEGFYMERAYGTEGIPVLIAPGAVAAIAAGAVAVSALAGAWPAWRATRLHPAEALRNG